jgi:hypothetical protein
VSTSGATTSEAWIWSRVRRDAGLEPGWNSSKGRTDSGSGTRDSSRGWRDRELGKKAGQTQAAADEKLDEWPRNRPAAARGARHGRKQPPAGLNIELSWLCRVGLQVQ